MLRETGQLLAQKPPMAQDRGHSGRLTALVAKIPQSHLAFFGSFLGMVAYALVHRHRRIVKRNLKFTHSEWSSSRIHEMSLRVFQNLGITALEIFQMSCMSRDDILRRVRIRGEHNLLSALKESNDKGIIFISAHLGNWEMSTLFVSNYLMRPVVAVAKHVKPKAFDRWMYRLRTRFGNTILYKKGALPAMCRTLRNGKMLGILIDQGTKLSEGVEVEFFGRTTTATPVAAMLARKYGSTVLPAFCIREQDTGHTLVVGSPIPIRKTTNPRADLQMNTQAMTDAIENAVKANPEQWFWFHKRWKRHYPQLYQK